MERSSRRGSKRFGSDRRRGSGYGKPRDGGPRGARRFEVDVRPRGMAHAPPPQYMLQQEVPADRPHFTSALYPAEPRFYNDLGHPDAGRVVLLKPDPVLYPASYLPSSGGYGVSPSEEYLQPSYLPLRRPAPVPVERFVELSPPPYLSRRPSLPLRRRPSPRRPVSTYRPARSERKRKQPRQNENDKRKKTEKSKQEEQVTETAKEVANPVEGMIFGCSNRTTKICKKLQLFGLPGVHENEVLRVIPGSKLFLFNYDNKHLSGVFEATSYGAMNIVPNAFQSAGSFPAQVKVKRVMTVPRLSLEKLHEAIPEIFYKGKHKFKYELNAAQVAKLLELFVSTKDKAAP
ncbi:hypothetical protein O6H91_07G090200 [Diphasiastrum complanatum]|uniref:Uncharacterized protein n=1 Tax=Diphasiastrum complanatum TaxID=34168 RepID=A0ACC2D7I0_DIPCM|nr:hypothetical protein O6H91_07G090200 [Diphasiastrum complanatum]